MKKNTQLIIITQNTWLYEGIAALLPGVRCLLMRFEDNCLPGKLEDSVRTPILVDSMILFYGLVDAFNILKASFPEPEVVWLSLNITGKLLPACWRNSWILEQKQPAVALRRELVNILRSSSLLRQPNGSAWLTKTECFLLSYFLSDLSMRYIARMTGKPEKTLYLHRRNILLKTGLSQIAFLRFLYRNWCELRDSGQQLGFCEKHDIFVLHRAISSTRIHPSKAAQDFIDPAGSLYT